VSGNGPSDYARELLAMVDKINRASTETVMHQIDQGAHPLPEIDWRREACRLATAVDVALACFRLAERP